MADARAHGAQYRRCTYRGTTARVGVRRNATNTLRRMQPGDANAHNHATQTQSVLGDLCSPTPCNMQHATCNMQRAASQRALGTTQVCTMEPMRRNLQHGSMLTGATDTLWHATCRVQHATDNRQHLACIKDDRATYDLEHAACSIRAGAGSIQNGSNAHMQHRSRVSPCAWAIERRTGRLRRMRRLPVDAGRRLDAE